MLTLTQQKNRVEKLLNNYPINWQDYEETPSRYKLPKPNSNKASLWLAITQRTETFTIVTSGDLTADMVGFIKRLIGSPDLSSGNHREWRMVSYKNICGIVDKFSELFSIEKTKSLDEEIFNDIQEIIESSHIDSTQKSSLIHSRVGQGKFRAGLIKLWGACSVTQSNHLPLLVASHIKPWSKSSNEERLDPYNGLLLLPNLDKAFDLGFISFDQSGNILISDELLEYEVLGISKNMSVLIKDKNKIYLNYHRLHIFKKE